MNFIKLIKFNFFENKILNYFIQNFKERYLLTVKNIKSF